MKRCVAPAHLLLALLLAAGLVSGADRVVETRRGEAGWDGPSCDRYGNWRSVPNTVTPAAMGGMRTYGRIGVPFLAAALSKAGDHPGNEVPFVGTERYGALVRTRRDGSCLPTRAGVDWSMRLSAARPIG